MAQVSINIRMDEDLKKEFTKLCDELGMSFTTAINIFAKKAIREWGIPFEVTATKPNIETLMAIEEAKKITKDPNVKSYKTVEEVMKALEED